MAKPYGDIGKEAKDLLSQEYINNGLFRITHQPKKTDGITLKSIFTRSLEGGKESISGSLEPKVDLKPFEVTAKLTTANEVSLGLNVKDFGLEGVKFETNAKQVDTKKTLSATLSIEKPKAHAKLNLLYPLSNAPKLTGEASFLASSVNLGLQAVYATSDSSLELFPSASFSVSRFLVTLSAIYGLASKKVVLTGSFFTKISDASKLALDVKYDLTASPKHEMVALAVGGEHRVDDSTLLKGKLRGCVINQANEARLSLALKQKLSSNVTSTIGLDLNVFGLLGSGNSNHSFGIDLKVD